MPTEDDMLMAALKARGKTPLDGLRVHDISAVGFELRCRDVAARGRMKDYLRVMSTRIIVRDEHGNIQDPMTFIFIPMMAWFIRALEEYYQARFNATSRSRLSERVFVPDEFLFKRQLRWVTSRWKGLAEAVEELDYASIDTLVSNLPVFTVHPVDNPPSPGE